MPSLGMLKALLGGSGRPQGTKKKLKKGSSVHSRSQHRQNRHPDGSSSDPSSHEPYGRMEHRSELIEDPLHQQSAYSNYRSSLKLPHYQGPDTYAPTPMYPSQLPRFNLYDNPVPAPAPVHSRHHGSIHDSYHPLMYDMVPVQSPLPHPQPSFYQEPISGANSWEPIPDVYRQSTIIDPEGFEEEYTPISMSYEEDKGRQVYINNRVDERTHNPTVPPINHQRGHPIHRAEMASNASDDLAWAGGSRGLGQHAIEHDRVHPRQTLAHHRQDARADEHHLAMGVPRSHRDDHSQHQDHSSDSDRHSLRHRLSRVFDTRRGSEEGPTDKHSSSYISDGQTNGPNRGYTFSPAPSVEEHRKSEKVREGSRHAHGRSGDTRGHLPDEADVYQYIVPPGVNVIFKDEDGNEITRVGEFHDMPKGKRKGHQGAPIVVFDQHGNVLYQDADKPENAQRRTPNQYPPSSPKSQVSNTSSTATKTILISPKGEQIHIGNTS